MNKYLKALYAVGLTLSLTSINAQATSFSHGKLSEVIRVSKEIRHYRKTNQKTPSKKLAQSVLTDDVRRQVGQKIQYNGHGAFIIDDNRTKLNAKTISAPYAVNKVDSLGRPTEGNAWLNKSSRQYRNRYETGNGATDFKPQGFIQRTHLKGAYNHAYDRGHLLGYALVGNVRGFDASESNPRNIATQTAWANEARSKVSTGQNYYERIVRKALDSNKKVRYRVTNVYQGQNKVPSGAHLEAKSSDNSVEFNVFIPNVQPGLKINYATGQTIISKE